MIGRRSLIALFFLSGVSALIYQVAWFRVLALVFGVTSYALGVVLAAFMAGLALGGLAGGWFANRVARPLTTYALVEMAIGVLGVSVMPLLNLVQALYVWLAPGLADHPGALAVLRFALAFALLLLPTACMGATLPLLARGAVSRFRSTPMISQLYAANTAGAVMGVLLAGFLLIGLLGLQASVLIAATLNVGTGIYLLTMNRESQQVLGASPSERSGLSTALTSVQRIAVVVFAISGLTSLAYEVVWMRLFSVLSFGLVYAYAVMLAVLLIGIAAGSALYGWWSRARPGAVWHLAWLELGIGAFVGSFPLWLALLANSRLLAGLTGWPVTGVLAERCPGCVILLPALLLVVFFSSLMFGGTFPAAVRTCGGAGPRWVLHLGVAYAANVIGGVLGSLMAGFWLLPALGAHGSILVLAALNFGAAATLVTVAGQPSLAVVMLMLGAMVIAPSVLARSTLDVYRTLLVGRFGQGSEILWYDEGIESSVAVGRRQSGERLLLINGEFHASTNGVTYHRQLGHLGPLLHPNPADVLVIGLGGGTTAGTIALYPGTRVHIVELSDGVFGAAELFADVNYRVLANPRVTRQRGDGRNHLLVGRGKYDLIVADILQPKHAGAGVIYSREYFELVRNALKPGGMMVQWLGTPEKPREYTWTFRTFASVFPHVTLWMSGDVAVGSNEPQPGLDRVRVDRLLRDRVLRAALTDVQLASVAAITELQVDSTRLMSRAGPVITDDRPSIEYFLTLPLLSRQTASRPAR